MTSYLPMKKAYQIILGQNPVDRDQITFCEEYIRQKAAMGEITARIYTSDKRKFDLDHQYFNDDVFFNMPASSFGEAIIDDPKTNKRELVNGRVVLCIDDLRKNKNSILKELNRSVSPANHKIDLSNPAAKKFDRILQQVAHVIKLNNPKTPTEMDCFKQAKHDFDMSLSVSSIKNIWNGNYPTSKKLGFTKGYIQKNYH